MDYSSFYVQSILGGQSNVSYLISDDRLKNDLLKKIELKINLITPGIMEKKSYWKNKYEIRFASIDELDKYRVNGNLMLNSQNKIGKLVKKGTFKKKNLLKLQNREKLLKVSLKRWIRKQITTDTAIGKHQFILYSKVTVYDEKLNETAISDVNWLFSLSSFPNGDFGLSIEFGKNVNNVFTFTREFIYPWKSSN